MGVWFRGEAREKLIAMMRAGELEGKSCRQIAKLLDVSAPYVSVVLRQLRERGAAESVLPRDAPPPDDTPLEKVRFLVPLRAWNALMSYSWMFKPQTPIKVLRETPDDFLLAMPQMGRKAVGVIRNRFGYGNGYPDTARRLAA